MSSFVRKFYVDHILKLLTSIYNMIQINRKFWAHHTLGKGLGFWKFSPESDSSIFRFEYLLTIWISLLLSLATRFDRFYLYSDPIVMK